MMLLSQRKTKGEKKRTPLKYMASACVPGTWEADTGGSLEPMKS
jgi:hypothetical protein